MEKPRDGRGVERCAPAGLSALLGRRAVQGYRGTSLIRNTPLLGPYSRNTWGPMVVLGGGAVSCERGTPVPHLQENELPQDPTVGLCLGS